MNALYKRLEILKEGIGKHFVRQVIAFGRPAIPQTMHQSTLLQFHPEWLDSQQNALNWRPNRLGGDFRGASGDGDLTEND